MLEDLAGTLACADHTDTAHIGRDIREEVFGGVDDAWVILRPIDGQAGLGARGDDQIPRQGGTLYARDRVTVVDFQNFHRLAIAPRQKIRLDAKPLRGVFDLMSKVARGPAHVLVHLSPEGQERVEVEEVDELPGLF